jgi:hypothetical protein
MLPARKIPLARIRVKGKQRKNIDLSKWGIADAVVHVDVYTQGGNTIVEIERASETECEDTNGTGNV